MNRVGMSLLVVGLLGLILHLPRWITGSFIGAAAFVMVTGAVIENARNKGH